MGMALQSGESRAPAPLGLDAAEFAAARPAFERAMRILEVMLPGATADVVMLVDKRVWRASLIEQLEADSAPGAEWVRHSLSPIWAGDITQEPAWRDHPMVTGPPYLRFFAGAPIVLSGGELIGSLQAFGPTPQP